MKLKYVKILSEAKLDEYAIIFALLGEIIKDKSGVVGYGKYKGLQIIAHTMKSIPGIRTTDLRATGQQNAYLEDKQKVVQYLKNELKKRKETIAKMPDMSDMIENQIIALEAALSGDQKTFRKILRF